MVHEPRKVGTSPIVAVICGNLNMPAHTTRAQQASTMLFVLNPDLARDGIRSYALRCQ